MVIVADLVDPDQVCDHLLFDFGIINQTVLVMVCYKF